MVGVLFPPGEDGGTWKGCADRQVTDQESEPVQINGRYTAFANVQFGNSFGCDIKDKDGRKDKRLAAS